MWHLLTNEYYIHGSENARATAGCVGMDASQEHDIA